jgi:hypothetical protein
MVPVVHLNGTSKDELIKQLLDAGNALNAAVYKLGAAAPHGRDYYPLGDDAYKTARDQHLDRVKRIDAVMNELMYIAEEIYRK